MPQRIQAPDGTLVEFPDGMPDDQIAAVMRREYGGPDTRKTSQALGFMEGMFPVAQKVNRAGNPLDWAASAVGLDALDSRNQSRAVEGKVRNYFAQEEQTKRPGAIGKVAGGIVATVPAAMATRNPFIAGGIQGGMLSEADSAVDLAGDVALGGALNWAGGKALDAVADTIKPVIDPAVQRLKQAGVSLTPGMVRGGKAMAREDKAMSRPVVGDAIAAGRQKTLETFNIAAVDEALKPLGVKVPKGVRPGNDAIAFAKKQVSQAYDRVVPNLAVQLSGQQFAAKIAPAAQSLPKPQQQQLRQIISANLGNGRLAGQQLKNAQGEIRRLASSYGRSQAAAERELGRALAAVDDELTGAMMAQNPKWAPELQKANEAYRGYRIVADAASRADEGVANTGQLRQAVRRGDSTKNKDATARGKAFMQDFSRDARKVIPGRTPDSGTAGRQMAPNIFANVRGAADALAYNLDEGLQRFRLAPRPASARKAARTVRRAKPVAGGATVAIGSQARD